MPSIVEEVKQQPLLAIAAVAGVGGVVILLMQSKKRAPDTVGSQALYYPGGSQGVGVYSQPVPPVPLPNPLPNPIGQPLHDCPTGSHWDFTLNTCVPNSPDPNPGGDPPVPVPIPHGCRDGYGNDRPCPDPGPNPGPIPGCQAGWHYVPGRGCVQDGIGDDPLRVLQPMGAGLDGLFGGKGGGEPSAATSDIAYPRIYNNLIAMQAMRGFR